MKAHGAGFRKVRGRATLFNVPAPGAAIRLRNLNAAHHVVLTAAAKRTRATT